MKRIMLTPEHAARLLQNPHEKQRKINPGWVNILAQRQRDGTFVFNYDPILQSVYDGKMFNGGHRCSSVVLTGIPMDILIEEQADPTIFGKIDGQLTRRAHQFIYKPQSGTRVAGCRVVYWYDNHFDTPMDNRFDVTQEELLGMAQMFESPLDLFVPIAHRMHKVTTIPPSLSLGAMLIADREGWGDEAADFADRVSNPVGLDALDPAWRLVEKMLTSKITRGDRRRNIEDWTVFVRALNSSLTDSPLPMKFYSSRLVWPRVGETEKAYNRRANTLSMKRNRKAA